MNSKFNLYKSELISITRMIFSPIKGIGVIGDVMPVRKSRRANNPAKMMIPEW